MSQRPHTPFALVINTSIVRAAGESNHPTSQKCRDTLDAVERGLYRIAMCRELEEEWRRRAPRRPSNAWPFYASKRAMDWYTRMKRRRKVLWINLPQDSPLRHRVSVQAQALWPGIKQVEKDLFLIELALAADRRVISLNSEERDRFSQIAKDVPDLAKILWLNPAKEDVPEWLRNGAPDEPQYRLDP